MLNFRKAETCDHCLNTFDYERFRGGRGKTLERQKSVREAVRMVFHLSLAAKRRVSSTVRTPRSASDCSTCEQRSRIEKAVELSNVIWRK
jgi:hypothetical protein